MSVTQSDAERIRAQYAALTSHYRAIGPADILAAVLAARKDKPVEQPPLRKAA
ncbi:MAG: transcriptional regulator [Pseudaminobacter sp.]